ncbi:MAG: 1,4-alpha-glucan branching protein GlgB [Candidatus Omnitrophota bacterium]
MEQSVCHNTTRFTEEAAHLFKEGTLYRAYEHLGSHVMESRGNCGVYFAVWAPNAREVSVVGNFNAWRPGEHALAPRWDSSGVWEGFVAGIGDGHLYKYHIRHDHGVVQKKDPYAFGSEVPPRTASVVADISSYDWRDQDWMTDRAEHNALDAPMAVYELHLGSWRRHAEDNSWLGYRELADQLVDYIHEMGFTHVEFMPVKAHPYCGSWGYQVLGYFAPTSRYGSPRDLMYLIDRLHQNGIGVIMDWVPSHFPGDEHGLLTFDGTHLYEHEDPRKGFHPDWKSWIFNYGRHEVRSFLISSAMFWLDKYHIDGLRVDGVASMLYLDYSREDGQWVPNVNGGRENLEAIHLLKQLNETAYRDFPDVQMFAEESTDWPGVSRPTSGGGLGFGMKWNMGWMHDTLEYFSRDSAHRAHHHQDLTFSMIYAYTENFILALSHDEVVHGKRSLLERMPGDEWQKFANLRLLYAYLYSHPGKKLLFMGQDFAQRDEWNYQQSLDWHLLQYGPHQGVQRLVADLNFLYRSEPALYRNDFSPDGFEWIQCDDWQQSILCFVRKSGQAAEDIVIACNFTPVPRHHYRIGLPGNGTWREIFNSDAPQYGGSGVANPERLPAEAVSYHYRPQSMEITIPPLGAVMFQKEDVNRV